MKRAKYDIALRDGGRETVTGYVGGDFACRKGRYFWDFTHLPTGLALNLYPPHERKAEALAFLARLEAEGAAALPEHVRALVELVRGWGGCDTPKINRRRPLTAQAGSSRTNLSATRSTKMTNSTVTSRSRFSALVTTSPAHMGYDVQYAPTDAELFARHGADFAGTIGQVSKWLETKSRELGGVAYRVVIRRDATGEFIRRGEFREAAATIECARLYA